MGVISGQNYYLVVNGYEWTTARTNAQNIGGDLVVIDSSSENDFLVANFRDEITIDDW